MMTDIKKGDIWYIDKGYSVGCEQHSGRPAVIVSNDVINKFSEIVEVVYLTTKPKTNLPTHVVIESTNRRSTVLCEQITTVSTTRLGSFYGEVSPDEMAAIDAALAVSLNLQVTKADEVVLNVEDESAPISGVEGEDPRIAELAEQCAMADIKYQVLQRKYEALLNMVATTQG